MAQSVKIYSTPTCPYCKMAKQFLEENQVQYENIDVSVNQVAAQEMIQKSGQLGVPVLDIDGKIVVGFDKKKIKELLGLK
ncbi:MAG: glutaredoxin domain-containing protein [Candidatus Margulisbacteria bacterium]|nr:glutaredoxin domain-containing protein [Candidatus Margulisiibacteriota bacterium]